MPKPIKPRGAGLANIPFSAILNPLKAEIKNLFKYLSKNKSKNR
jgi:hypothetical protein